MGTKKPHMRCGFCRTYGIQDANPDTRSFRVQVQHTKKPLRLQGLGEWWTFQAAGCVSVCSKASALFNNFSKS